MLKICLVFWKSEPRYAYKRYAYEEKTCFYIEALHRGKLLLKSVKGFMYVSISLSNILLFVSY